MSNLHPEVRADKNGKLVTRNIKSEEPIAVRVIANAKPKPAAVSSKFIKDPSYENAVALFEKLNPEEAELFDHFYLGSKDFSDIDEVAEDTGIDIDDIKEVKLSNGYTSYWINEEHLDIPSDQVIAIEARDYKDILWELRSLEDSTEFGAQALSGRANDLEVYAAYHDMNGSKDLEELIKKADEAYRGSYRSDEDFAEETFESVFGYDSQDGIDSIGSHVNWDDVAATTTKLEIGIADESDDDSDDAPDEDEVRSYFENSIGSISGLSNYINWSSYSRSLLNDYTENHGHYFRD